MPRPSSHDHARLARFLANSGFFTNQSANTARGSWSGESFTVEPSGKTALTGEPFSAPAFVEAGLKKIISSFQSAVYLEPTFAKNTARLARSLDGQCSARSPRNVSATVCAIPAGVRFCIAR